ncbi:elongation factor P-like isoform X1 [Panicum virgatum]|uniref:elongation factor P-like isoform X1 n=1 Tax=Panicum virgatum TaxID=38727 RepID=UPI0019D5D1BA|nr:elongation factor P-like isoform X1 [Panicum virgatum]
MLGSAHIVAISLRPVPFLPPRSHKGRGNAADFRDADPPPEASGSFPPPPPFLHPGRRAPRQRSCGRHARCRRAVGPARRRGLACRRSVGRHPATRREDARLRRETWKCNTKKRCVLTSLVLYLFLQVSLTVTHSSLWSTLKQGRIYQVIKAQHSHQGRGGATIQVELRDVDTGNKITERFRTDEALERVFVEEKSFTYLYQEGDTVMLMEPETFEQIEVSKDLFGKAAAYLKDEMKVNLQYFDGRPMSATVPPRVTCTVVEAQPNTKGLTAQPQYKRVVLDNGLTVLAPPFIAAGEKIVISTADDSYMTRA